MIIGDDFLQHFQARINVKEKSVQLSNPVALNTLTCRERTVIPPFTRRPVTAGHNGPAISKIGVVIPKYDMFLKGIQEWDSDRATVKLHAINASAEEIVIQRGEELGSFLQVKPEDTGTLEAFKACRPAAARKSTLTPAKDKLIREEARVQIQDPQFKEALTRILRKYHDIISETTGDLGRTNAVPHKLIPRSDRQIYRKQFPIPEAHVPFVNKTVDELLRIGAIEPDLASHHNTPIFCVKKPHSTELRLVQDLRMVNDNVEDFFHPILDVQSCMAKLGGMGARYFAALDLTSGFYQLELDKESRPLTAFTVPGRGRFAWTVSTMGLKTSPGAFSRLMEHVMQPVKRSVTYMDDVILAGETPAALLETVEEALQQLQKYNLKLNSPQVHLRSRRGGLPRLQDQQARHEARVGEDGGNQTVPRAANAAGYTEIRWDGQLFQRTHPALRTDSQNISQGSHAATAHGRVDRYRRRQGPPSASSGRPSPRHQ
jgi:hypothetical protein